MKTVRRLYFYAVALISLEVVVWGLINLLRSMACLAAPTHSGVEADAGRLVLVRNAPTCWQEHRASPMVPPTNSNLKEISKWHIPSTTRL